MSNEMLNKIFHKSLSEDEVKDIISLLNRAKATKDEDSKNHLIDMVLEILNG